MNRTIETVRVGDVFPINDGGSVTVIAIRNSRNIDIRHNDRYAHVTTVRLSHLNNGTVKNPYFPSVCGVGYIGIGNYKAYIDRVRTKEYVVWSNMLSRCYTPSLSVRDQTYIECVVHATWHNFQNFAHWYVNHPFSNMDYELDKDILCDNNKMYSPTSCTLVPHVINNIFRDFSKSSSTRGLPFGVHRNGNGFEATACGIYLGTFNTIAEAQQIHREYKHNYISRIAEEYKYLVEVDVYYSLIALAHTQ